MFLLSDWAAIPIGSDGGHSHGRENRPQFFPAYIIRTK